MFCFQCQETAKNEACTIQGGLKMTVTKFQFMLMAILIAVPAIIFAQTQITGLQIIENEYNRPVGNDSQSDLTMSLINSRGDQRVRTLKQFNKDFGNMEKKIMFFISPADVRIALSHGVQHVIHKPFNKTQLLNAVLSSFAVSDSYTTLVDSYIEEIELNQQLFMSAIDGFAAAIGARDGYTLHHSEQVADFAVLLSRKIGLDDKNVQTARIAGKLHDIGKIGVPEDILLKRELLTQGEFDVMKGHPEKAAEILGSLPSLAAVIDGAKHHHERFDGTGYPDGLVGENIPLMGRILAICDAFSAMITERPYRPAILPEKAREEILLNSSTQFDPELVIAFLAIPEIIKA